MTKSKKSSIFKTDKRIKLGIWGLGRGMTFQRVASALNMDIVAGCDYNEHMRKRFMEQNPEAFATDDAEAFLNSDIDAVVMATYCPAHGADAIKCLESGKHVLSEVTAFHTLAEGVRLVEAVERSGLVYNLAENVPFNKPNLYLAAKWREGLFGEFMYAEFEYVHECRSLCYTYIDGTPVRPGYTPHNWRSWLDFHYYNTHSLGPVMHITSARPTRVVSLPSENKLPGYLLTKTTAGMGTVAPSLITMSNGGLMRNLMGATTNDSHIQRLWGNKGSAEINNGLFLRLGGAGHAPKLEVTPEWPELGEYADTMGHGGADFWVVYNFARHILFGEPACFDVYTAADCTIPGILALRSSMNGGKPYDVPDFRKKKERDKYRHDDFAQKRYDVNKGCFPLKADKKLTGQFTTIMKDLIRHAVVCRSVIDWTSVFAEVKEPERVIAVVDQFISEHDAMKRTMAAARKLANAYPRSDGARVLREMMSFAEAERVTRKSFLEWVKKEPERMLQKARRND